MRKKRGRMNQLNQTIYGPKIETLLYITASENGL